MPHKRGPPALRLVFCIRSRYPCSPAYLVERYHIAAFEQIDAARSLAVMQPSPLSIGHYLGLRPASQYRGLRTVDYVVEGAFRLRRMQTCIACEL